MDSSSVDKKRSRDDSETIDPETKEPEAKKAKTQETGQSETERLLLISNVKIQARLDILERKLEEAKAIIAEYARQHPLRPPRPPKSPRTEYYDNRWDHFRTQHRNCSDLNDHYKQEMAEYDRHHKPTYRDANGKVTAAF